MFGIGNLGWQEITLILLVVLLLFGARRLPEIGQSLGRGIREFKKSISGSAEEEVKPPQEPKGELQSPQEQTRSQG